MKQDLRGTYRLNKILETTIKFFYLRIIIIY